MNELSSIINVKLDSAVNGVAAMFVGLTPSLPPLFLLVKTFCVMLGLGMIVHTVFQLKNMRNRQNPAEFRPILVEFIAAIALINLNLMIAMGAETLFGAGLYSYTPLAYQVTSSGSDAMRMQNIALAILAFIQLVGYISVARGITELNNHSKGKVNCSLGKGLTHIIGGIFACNIILTAQMLSSTFLPVI